MRQFLTINNNTMEQINYFRNYFSDFKRFSERLAQLSLEERRKGYFCPNNYKELSAIPTWGDYFKEHEKSLSEKGKKIRLLEILNHVLGWIEHGDSGPD